MDHISDMVQWDIGVKHVLDIEISHHNIPAHVEGGGVLNVLLSSGLLALQMLPSCPECSVFKWEGGLVGFCY